MSGQLIDVGELMNDQDFCQHFQVKRTDPNSGQWVPGGFDQQVDTLDFYGISQVADPRTIAMIPESDRVLGARVFWSNEPIYETQAAPTAGSTVDPQQGVISDSLVFHGEDWKVVHVWGWQDNGYWKALAVRKRGA